MLISSVAVGLALALARCRGDVRALTAALATLRFRWWWLVVPALCLKFALVRVPDAAPWFAAAGPALHLVVYALLLAPLIANLHISGMPAIALGTALNGIVIVANGGRMPVPESTLAALGKTGTSAALKEGRSVTHTLTTPDTPFAVLGDWIAFPPPWSSAISIGDVALAAGVIWLLVAVARTEPSPASPSTSHLRGDASGAG